nr:hypothetical protein Iba_chr04cCG14030 [Ipomoea batatas]
MGSAIRLMEFRHRDFPLKDMGSAIWLLPCGIFICTTNFRELEGEFSLTKGYRELTEAILGSQSLSTSSTSLATSPSILSNHMISPFGVGFSSSISIGIVEEPTLGLEGSSIVLKLSYDIYHQLCDGEWEVIFRTCNIKIPKVHAYMDLAFLLAYRHNVGYPSWVFNFADEASLYELVDFSFN